MTRLLTLMFAMLMLLPAAAQSPVGGWELLTPFNGVTDMVATPGKIYYLSGSAGSACLFSYDMDNDETYAYNTGNKLNDSGINLIRYNREKGYLVVAYASGNMDVIMDDGSVINLADISEAPLTQSKDIVYIGFDDKNNYMYVCTSFGLVRYNDDRFEVTETGMYNTQVDMACVVGDRLVIRNNNALKHIGSKESIARLSHFTVMPVQDVIDMRCTGGNRAVMLKGVYKAGASRTVYVADFDFDNNVCSETVTKGVGLTLLHDSKDCYTLCSQSSVIVVNPSDGQCSWYSYPEGSSANNMGAIWDVKERMWTGTPNGISSYTISKGANGKPVFTHELTDILPTDMTLMYVKQIQVADDGSLYFGNYFPSSYQPNPASSTVNVLRPDGRFYDVTSDKLDVAKGHQGYLTPVPGEPGTYWTTCPAWGTEYIIKVRDGKEVYRLDAANRPAALASPWYPSQAAFDAKGNLWVASEFTNDDKPSVPLLFLPAAKAATDDIKPADWKYRTQGDFRLAMDARMVVCHKSNVIILVDNTYNGRLATYNTKGTDSMNDDTLIDHKQLYDQDGKTFEPTNIICAVEDLNGRVWVGTSDGIIEITDPEEFSLNSAARINRIKVPRNDGTNFADYLLDAVTVRDIAVDGLNRKWVATTGSGVYLVSADGREIIANYTTANSALPSNDIYSVECDPNSNKVYFGSLNGLVVYSSTSSPGADSYDDVYAYPNPVRPEYTGWITVTGLMDNSLVKIADAAGNVFYSGRSEGGMITWDGCGSDGSRVRTGVYYVFASQSGDGGTGSSGAVTKILVVN